MQTKTAAIQRERFHHKAHHRQESATIPPNQALRVAILHGPPPARARCCGSTPSPGQCSTGILRSEERPTLTTLFTPSILSSAAVLRGAPCSAEGLVKSFPQAYKGSRCLRSSQRSPGCPARAHP